MEINKEGKLFKKLSKYSLCQKCLYYIEKENIEEAYNIANQSGNQMVRDLTMYLIKEKGEVFRYDPLLHLDYVPSNYLYEANDKNLSIYVNSNIKEIKGKAFAYCRIKRLVISKSVEKIGDVALCLNEGEIIYEGTKQEFINKFLGKSKCFVGTHENQQITCSDGIIEIFKEKMKMNNLQNFKIDEIMKNIQHKMPFYNERHFQIEMVLALKEHFKNNEDIEIDVEAYYGDPSKNDDGIDINNSRRYTDIVIHDGDGNYLPIELKYCLTQKGKNVKRNIYNNGNYEVSIAKKGARNNCRYDFLKDVHRLEEFSQRKNKYENERLQTFCKGYAIIISNDDLIMRDCSPNNKNPNLYISQNQDKNFCIGDESKTSTNCNWGGGQNTKTSTTRPDFNLSNSYDCEWQPKEGYYFEDKGNNGSPPFKYLVIEVK